jgi:hypothetical protein
MAKSASFNAKRVPTRANPELAMSDKHGVRDIPISSAKPWHSQMTDPHYIEGPMAVTRFDAKDWPAARSTITEMLVNRRSNLTPDRRPILALTHF